MYVFLFDKKSNRYSLSLYEELKDYIRNYHEEYMDSEYYGGVVLASLSEEEVIEIIRILDHLFWVNSFIEIRKLIIDNFIHVINLVRAVKRFTYSNFRGYNSRGHELTMTLLNTDSFKKIWNEEHRETFEFEGDKNTSYVYLGAEILDSHEGILILGFIDLNRLYTYIKSLHLGVNFLDLLDDLNDYPIDKIFYSINGMIYHPITLNMEFVSTIPFIKCPKPIYLLPESDFEFRVHFKESGHVELVPFGFKVTRVDELISLWWMK